MAFPKNNFLASFEHLCLIPFDFMIHLSSNNNTQYFLITRSKKLEDANIILENQYCFNAKLFLNEVFHKTQTH